MHISVHAYMYTHYYFTFLSNVRLALFHQFWIVSPKWHITELQVEQENDITEFFDVQVAKE